jgi:signal transduction histidine kinase
MTRVLLVEDNPGDARLIEELLRECSEPFAVSHVKTLAEAIGRVDVHDVALLDLTLPDASGITTVQRLAIAARALPIVVLTGNADDQLGIEALSAGAQDYLRKGEIVPALLAKALRYAIERKRMVALEVAQQQLEEAVTRARFVAEVTAAATGSLEVVPGMRAVASLLVPSLADGCVIELNNAGRLERIAIGEVGAGSRLTLPLVSRGKALGSMVLASARGFRDQDRLLADEISARIGLGIDNAMLYGDAQRAVRARDEMMAIVSHDLRNPLGVVQLTLGMLETDPAMLPTALPRAVRAVEQMRLLIDDLLQISQIDAGTLSIETRRVELEPLLEDVYEHHRMLAADKRINVRREVSALIGPLDIDTRRLSQALGNVLGNAIKYTPNDGEIVLSARSHEDGVLISVRDTGPGIPSEHVSRIFDRFWQADRRRRDGVGLGLPIAKGIIERHGGRIDVTSELGRGTTFLITLPQSATKPATT